MTSVFLTRGLLFQNEQSFCLFAQMFTYSLLANLDTQVKFTIGYLQDFIASAVNHKQMEKNFIGIIISH